MRKQSTRTKFLIVCDCGCGEIVTARDAGFEATTCTVSPCGIRFAAGIMSATVRKSAAFAAIVSESSLRHRDGFVTFRASEVGGAFDGFAVSSDCDGGL